MSFNPQFKSSPDTVGEGQRSTGTVDSTGALRVTVTSSGSGSSSTTVQGAAADDAAAVGNPVLVGGKYETTPNPVEDGDASFFKVDTTGRLLVNTNGNINVAATATTRPANTTAYTANDSISNNGTAGSVTATSVTVSDLNDAPVDLTEILLDTDDTGPGTAGATIRLHIFNSDPTASSGVGAGDNAAWSNKKAGWVGSFSGTMRAFSDGSRGVLIPDEGTLRIANPVSGAKTLYYQLQTLTAFTPSANSTVFTPRFKGFQGRS